MCVRSKKKHEAATYLVLDVDRIEDFLADPFHSDLTLTFLLQAIVLVKKLRRMFE